MGDVRFEGPYERVRAAEEPTAAMRELEDSEVIAALAGATTEKDPYLANVLATEAMNRVLRADAITESLGEGVLATDAALAVERANPAAEAALGWSEEEMIGRPLHDLLHPTGGEAEDEGACPLAAPGQRRASGETLLARRDASTFPAEFTCTPLLRHGTFRGVVLVFHDVTRARAARRTLEGQRNFLEGVVDRAVKASEERRRAEARLTALLDGAPDPVVIANEQGEIILANSQVEAVFGYERGQIEGQPVEMLMPERFRRGHTSHRAGFMAAPITRPMGTGLQLYGLRANGEEFPVEISLSPVRTEEGLLVMAAIRDVTDRQRAEERLRRSEALLQEAQMLAGIGSWEWDIEANRVAWSEEMRRIFGIPSGESIAFEDFLALVHPQDRDRVRAVIEHAARTGRPFSFFHRIVRSDREVRILHGRGEVVTDAEGRPLRMVGTGQDVTEQQRAEEETRTRNAALQAQVAARTRELDAVSRQLEMFAAAAVRDLQAALRVVEAASAEVEEVQPRLDPDARTRLRRIREEARRARAHISNLHALAAATRARMAPARVDLSALAEQIVAGLQAEEPRTDVQVDVEPGLVAVCDPPLVRAALTALLRNAWDGTRAMRRPLIRVGARPVLDGLEFYVQDNGAGLSPAQTAALRAPWAGIDREIDLPLVIAQRVVDRHGGRIQAHGETGRGTTVYFTLPPPRPGPGALSATPQSEDDNLPAPA